MKSSNLEIFGNIVSQIRAVTPSLEVSQSENVPSFVDRQYSWGTQPGLNVGLCLSLQNDDELHLCIGSTFWAEFRPVDDEDVGAEVADRVIGFIRGDYRVETAYFGNKIERSLLQHERNNGEWECLQSSIPFNKTGWIWEDYRVEITRNRESGRREVLTPAPHTTGHTDP